MSRKRHQYAANAARQAQHPAPPALTVNTSDYDLRRARESLMSAFGSIDAKRPAAWDQYGYKSELKFDDYRRAYERGGPAFGAVHRILDRCWQEAPRIKRPEADEESDWEKGVAKVLKAVRVWPKLRDLDRRNMVGVYAGLIYRVADGKMLREPMERAAKLVDVIPLFEDQLQVIAWHTDQTDAENFGKPSMWQYRQRRVSQGDTQGKPDEWVDVHPSRVQILAEGAVGSNFFDGVPLLKAGFNALVDLEKISGGSAESFLKNSARTLTFKFDANSSPAVLTQNPDGTPTGKTVAQVLEEKTQALNSNVDSSIVLQGGEASTLQTTVSDPTGAFLLAANLFSASVQIPFTILFGQQTGRLASDEDKADMTRRCRSRQENVLSPMIEEFVTRMQAAGILEAGEFEVEWCELESPTEAEQFDNLGKLTAAMKQAFDAGITEPLFDANELRGVAGFEERPDDGMPTEGDDAAAQAAAAAAAAMAGGAQTGTQPAGTRPPVQRVA